MIRRPIALLLVSALATACVSSEAATRPSPVPTAGARATEGPAASPSLAPSPSADPPPSPDPSPSPEPDPAREVPPPDARVPGGAERLARALEATVRANRQAIADWLALGDPGTWPPPRDVVLLTLYEQRIVRLLSARGRLATRTLERVPGDVRREVMGNVRSGRALFEHFRPVPEVPDFKIRRPQPADVLLGHFHEAEERFGVDWEVLAAIMLVETRMGRIRSRSSAGAVGPMQFLPSTWAAYGMGGNVRDPRDAVLGAANYLRSSGAPGDYRAALHAYNPVDAYVRAVRGYARTMMRSPRSYYAFSNWQVFVRTVDGDVRLSGPGA